jgi:flagellar motor switch protein FliG
VDAFFTSLSKKETMLLLTAVTFGGQESLAAFEHLEGEVAETLKHRATELLQIPKDKRIPILVQEIKRLVTAKKGYLWASDPERLSRVLKDERPSLVEVLLRALPSTVAEAVRKQLRITPPKLKKEVKPEILSVVRWKLEEVLAREVPQKVQLRFSDLLLLQPRELLTLAERIGTKGIAPAVAGLEDAEREGFLQALTPNLRIGVVKAIEAAPNRKLETGAAKEQLSQLGAKNPAEMVWSHGAQRLARACLAQSPEFAQRVVERQRGELAPWLTRWLRDEKHKGQVRGDAGRAEIVIDLEKLASAGIVERPIRLPAPPRPEPVQAPPPPRAKGKGGPGEIPAISFPQKNRGADPGRRRDPIAEREARRAGMGSNPPASERGIRDPIAERNARRSGARTSHPPGEQPGEDDRHSDPRLSRPILPRPPSRRGR